MSESQRHNAFVGIMEEKGTGDMVLIIDRVIFIANYVSFSVGKCETALSIIRSSVNCVRRIPK